MRNCDFEFGVVQKISVLRTSTFVSVASIISLMDDYFLVAMVRRDTVCSQTWREELLFYIARPYIFPLLLLFPSPANLRKVPFLVFNFLLHQKKIFFQIVEIRKIRTFKPKTHNQCSDKPRLFCIYGVASISDGDFRTILVSSTVFQNFHCCL